MARNGSVGHLNGAHLAAVCIVRGVQGTRLIL